MDNRFGSDAYWRDTFERNHQDYQDRYNNIAQDQKESTKPEYYRSHKVESYYHCDSVYLDDIDNYYTNLWDINNPCNEYIIVRCGRKKKQIPLSQMMDPKIRHKVIGGYYAQDLYYTPNTFKYSRKICGDAHATNQYRIVSWALDVDYRKVKDNDHKDPLGYWMHYLSDAVYVDHIIPEPNYIEYGHQLRLIYLLPDPINCSCGKKMISVIKAIQVELSKKLNEHYNCNCEPQKINLYYRVPGSINSKNGATIKIQQINKERIDLRDILNTYMPPYTPKISAEKRKTVSSGKKKRYNNLAEMHKKRISDFEALRSVEDIPREKLCHLFINALMQLDLGVDYNYMDALLEFNGGFQSPLKESELKSKLGAQIRSRKTYAYSNRTIRLMLGLYPEQVADLTIGKVMPSKDAARIKKANLINNIIERYNNGEDYKTIAGELSVSSRTVRRYVDKYLQTDNAQRNI